MKIRGGYEISYDCSQPTPMILTLSVHPSRFSDLLTIDRLQLDPPLLPAGEGRAGGVGVAVVRLGICKTM